MVDHRDVEVLFDQIEAVCDESPEQARDLFTVLADGLLAHARAEQSIVYARFARIPALAEKIREAEAEHEAVELLIGQLRGVEPDAERWLARVMVLRENVQHHVKEEETEVFPVAREQIGDAEAKRLAASFLTAKARRTGNPETVQARGRKPEKKRGLLARLFG